MIRIKAVNNEIYHIYNRGVEKRNIFLEEMDYLRFVHDLFEFNDQNPVPNLGYYFNHQNQSKEVGLQYIVDKRTQREPRKLLVELMVFCLMPNHFHLMVRQKVPGGVTEFMRKIGAGYTNYFNQKYDRVGPLFQGKYKLVHVKDETHFLHLPYYIHCNPLDLIMPKWRDGEIANHRKAMSYLENYRWSSFLDYIGLDNFKSVTQRDFILEFAGGPQKFKQQMIKWLNEMNLEDIKPIALE